MSEQTTVPTHSTEPPRHDGLPVIGNTHQLVRGQGGLYEAAAEQGDIVQLQIPGIGDFYQVNHLDLSEQILVTDRDQFQKASLSQDDLGDLLGQGLVLSEGELWERQRERIQPAFYMMTFLFAGHETTATALTFTWYLLGQHPDIQRRLAEEVEAVLDDEYATFEDLSELEYTEQVLREAMRLYPPVASIPRETTESVELAGYKLPEGATVTPMQWTIHRDERFWEEPQQFRPERFAGESDRPKFAYFPFGGGPRPCIGQQFALVEGQLILATLARQYEARLVSDPDIDLSVSITTRPLNPIELQVEPRE